MTNTENTAARTITLAQVAAYEERAVVALELARTTFDLTPDDPQALATFTAAIETASVQLAKAHAWKVANGHA